MLKYIGRGDKLKKNIIKKIIAVTFCVTLSSGMILNESISFADSSRAVEEINNKEYKSEYNSDDLFGKDSSYRKYDNKTGDVNFIKTAPDVVEIDNRSDKEVKDNLKGDKNDNINGDSVISNSNSNNDKKDEKNDRRELIRISGVDRIETAVKVSRNFAKSGATVILASSKNYADALSASSITDGKNPLLLTNKSSLSQSAVEEIKRINPKKVIIIGGYSSIDQNVEGQVINMGYEVQRFQGSDRYETSANVSEASNKPGYIIASGENYPDALSAAVLTKSRNSSIYLTRKGALPKTVAVKISKKKSQGIVAGGSGSVSSKVLGEIKNTSGYYPNVLKGTDRYETSVKIAQMKGLNDSIVITTGENFPDSLSASAFAQNIDAPILLTNKKYLNSYVGKYMEENLVSIKRVYVIGGLGSIETSVEDEITDIFKTGKFTPKVRPNSNSNNTSSNNSNNTNPNNPTNSQNPNNVTPINSNNTNSNTPGNNPNFIVKNGVYRINTPYISQLYPLYAPVGCEGTSMLMALKAKGYAKDVSLKEFLDKMPKTTANPNLGFVGSPYKAENRYTTINPAPLANYARKYGDVVDVSGYSTDNIITEIKRGNPVLMWNTIGWQKPRNYKYYYDGKAHNGFANNHCVAAIGYDKNRDQILFADPLNTINKFKSYFYWKSKAVVKSIYELRKFAVMVR